METSSSCNHQQASSFASMWNGSEDEDYRIFLDIQMVHGDDDMDPLYKTFLEHVREDGHSYTLEMANGDHGLPVFVKYEVDSESPEEIDIELQRSCQNISRKNERKRKSANKFSRAKGMQSQESDFSMILEWESSTVRYEEVNGASNSSGLTTEDTLHNGEQELVPYGSPYCASHVTEEDDSPTVICRFSDSSQFRKQLNAVLAQPFDPNEYEKLLKEATDRKPLEKQKHLRSSSISYPTNSVGMSYLDHHPDLAKQLESADSHKRLELLRGFFFWLKNLCHEGAFMPWVTVPSSLDTLITSGYEVVLPLGDRVEDIQGAPPSIASCVEDVVD